MILLKQTDDMHYKKWYLGINVHQCINKMVDCVGIDNIEGSTERGTSQF